MNPGDQRRLVDLLAKRLQPVTRRARLLRLLQGWAALAAGTAALCVVLRILEERRGWRVGAGWPLLVLGALAGAFWIWRRGRASAADEAQRAAQLIEAQSPELRALLLTAVAQTASPAGLSYLQEQVVREAVERSAAGSWSRAVSQRKLRALGAGTAGAALVVAYCVLSVWLPNLSSLFRDSHGLQVTPGDTSVERGANLLVLARFDRTPTGGVELVVRVPGQPPQRQPMRRNLEDPVWGALIPALARDTDYFVEHEGGRSPGYHITVFEAPELDRLDARIEYPRQPALAAREVADARFLSVLEGARVTLTARLRGPARQVQLVPETRSRGATGPSAAPPVAFTPAGKPARTLWQVVLSPTASRRYNLRITDDEGRQNEAPPRLSIELQKNQPPELRLAFPGRDVRVSPLEELTVEAKLSDDTAIEGHGVTYRRAGQPPREVRLGGASQPAVTQLTARAVINVEDLGAQPAELVTYHFWAEDRDGAGRLRRTASDMYFAEVRPFEERYREQSGGNDEGPPGGGAAAAEQARRQKDIINATWKLDRQAREVQDGGPLGPIDEDAAVVAKAQATLATDTAASRVQARDGKTRSALEAAASAMNAAKTALEQAARLGDKPASDALPPLSSALEAEQRAYAALLRLRDTDHNVSKGRGGGAGQGENDAPALAGLELKQKESRYETRREAGKEMRAAQPKREALGRLDELARRQKALTERLKEASAALEARSPEEKAEAQRRLQRLRDEQQELIEDLDRLNQRLASQSQEAAGSSQADEGGAPGNKSGNAAEREALERTRAELESTRKEAAAASEAMARGENGRALGASARAERQLDKTRRDLARDVAAGLDAEMRGLRDAARDLDDRQRKIAEALGQSGKPGADPTSADKGSGAPARSLESEAALNPTVARQLAGDLRKQKDQAEALLRKLEAVSSEAESAAPLLSRKLYDGLREAKLAELEKALGTAGNLLERNLADEGKVVESRARRAVADLRGRVDDAAKGVLGDEAAALRAAQAELDTLIAEASKDGAAAPATAAPGAAAAAGKGDGDAAGKNDGKVARNSRGKGSGPGQVPGANPGGGEDGEGQASGNAGGATAGGPGGSGPITGDGFRNFAERLRDVEDLLEDSRLRNQAAGVRDRARALRAEWKERGTPPARAVLEKSVLQPLTELRLRVSEQLGRLDRNDKLVPLDRDPIPARYTDLVRRYWKSLSEGRAVAPAPQRP